MTRFWALTKVAMKTSLVGNDQGKSTKPWVQPLIFLIFGVFVAPLMVMGVQNIHGPLAVFGFQSLIPTLVVILLSVLMMGFSFMQIIEVFFYANDIEYLLPLPFKSWEILMAKFVTIMWIPYGIALMLYLPVMITFGVLEGSGAVFYIWMALSFFFIPLYPTILMCLLLMVLMRVTNLGKYRDQIRTVMLLLVSFSGLFTNLAIQRLDFEALDMQMLMDLPVVRVLRVLFQPVLLAIDGILDPVGNGYRLAGSFALTLIALLIFIGVSESLYFKSVAGFNQVGKSKSTIKEGHLRVKGARFQLVARDFRNMLRTPAFAISCLITPISLPFIVLISFFSGDGGISEMAGMLTADLFVEPYSAIFLGIVFAAFFFFTATNTMAYSSISREGKSFGAFKYLPISLDDLIMSKLAVAIGYNLLIEWALITGFAVFFRVPWHLALSLYVFTGLSVVFHSLLGFYLDFSKPNLDWDSEKGATNGRGATVVMIFLSLGIAGLGGFLAFRYATGVLQVLGIAYGFLVFGICFLWRLLQRHKVELFSRL